MPDLSADPALSGNPTVTFATESGSLYEIDATACLVRRITGTNRPTPHQGADGKWRKYAAVTVEGWSDGEVSLMFAWDVPGELTQTSPLVRESRDLVLQALRLDLPT